MKRNVFNKLFSVFLSVVLLAGCGGGGGGGGGTTLSEVQSGVAVSLTSGKVTNNTNSSGDLLLTDLPESISVTVDGTPTTDFDTNEDGTVQVQAKAGQTVAIQGYLWAKHRIGQETLPSRVKIAGVAKVGAENTVLPLNINTSGTIDEDPSDIAAEGDSQTQTCLSGDCQNLSEVAFQIPDVSSNWEVAKEISVDGRKIAPELANITTDADGFLTIEMLKTPANYWDVQGIAAEVMQAGRYRWNYVLTNTSGQIAKIKIQTLVKGTWSDASSTSDVTLSPGSTTTLTTEFDAKDADNLQFTISMGDSPPGAIISFGKIILERQSTPLAKALTSKTASKTVAKDKTSSGFYWPISKSYKSGAGTWLARDKSHGGGYFAGLYHIGVDMLASEGTPVYAIDDGKVVSISTSSKSNGYCWGVGNSAVMVQHKNKKKKSFLALYGHIHPNVKLGSSVSAGQKIGTVGPYTYGSHLHFGIRKNSDVPRSNWGTMPNSSWSDTNGFVDPVDYIKSNSP